MKKSKRMMRKFLLILSSALLLVSLTVGATVAYLTSTDEVVNTFTVGKVAITMDEAKVNEYGELVYKEGTQELEARVDNNTYKLLPGHTYVKDPTVTVAADSEESYIRMLVTVSDIEALKEALPDEQYYGEGRMFLLQTLVKGWDGNVWPCTGVTADATAGTCTYEFRYYQTVSTADGGAQTLAPLFTHIKMPGEIDNDHLDKLKDLNINVVAYAIQADGFNGDADDAWEAFDGQQAATTPDADED